MLLQTQSISTNELSTILLKLLLFLFFFIILFISNQLAIVLYKKYSRSSRELQSHRTNYINFFFFLIYVSCIIVIFSSEIELLVGGSAFIATIATVSLAIILSNFIGGIYIYITRPFWNGDLISIQSNIGVVEKIGLNYTILKTIDQKYLHIPNSLLIDAILLNTKSYVSNETKKNNAKNKIQGTKQLLARQMNREKVTFPVFLENTLINTFGQEGIYRFPLHLEIDLNILDPPLKIEELCNKIDRVIDKYSSVFEFIPNYFFGNNVFRQDVYFIITSNDVKKIYSNYSHFLDELVTEIYFDEKRSEKVSE